MGQDMSTLCRRPCAAVTSLACEQNNRGEPLSGMRALLQVAVCCFDKTGTLTSDDMVLRGLAAVPEKGRELLQDVKAAGRDTLRVLAACQSLIQIEGDLVGDPLERAAFEATGEAATSQIQRWET